MIKNHPRHYMQSGAHYLEPPSPILTLGVNPFPYIFIFRTDLLRFLPGVFASLHQLLHSDPLLLRSVVISKITMARSVEENLRSMQCTTGTIFFAGNMFLKIKRYGKGLTQGCSAAPGNGLLMQYFVSVELAL